MMKVPQQYASVEIGISLENNKLVALVTIAGNIGIRTQWIHDE